ncbi:hypothetical protein Pla52n_67450 [Stieleria varia]|uniref:DUF6892 domain-containing protein n=2 Tax=Stieleria varia TaxID=2528005 RepID=A0A5C5ZRT1_9BACT|nr:hypothetical protein Pla52n_67450 [Stieleria varia]
MVASQRHGAATEFDRTMRWTEATHRADEHGNHNGVARSTPPFAYREYFDAMQFADRNFRLACIDAIHCVGHLPDVFDEPESDAFADRIALLEAVVLTDELLRQLTRFSPDGGDDVYLFADPEWGAENDELYISRFDDLVLLPNLESIWVHAVTNEGAFDLSLLLECRSLKTFRADSFYVKPSDANDQIIERLVAGGVDVRID